MCAYTNKINNRMLSVFGVVLFFVALNSQLNLGRLFIVASRLYMIWIFEFDSILVIKFMKNKNPLAIDPKLMNFKTNNSLNIWVHLFIVLSIFSLHLMILLKWEQKLNSQMQNYRLRRNLIEFGCFMHYWFAHLFYRKFPLPSPPSSSLTQINAHFIDKINRDIQK